MEKVLLRLARQLNAFDEASLMALWDAYAQKVQEFEPTKRWEEAALVFSLLQAVRWKNQLFNYNWAAGVKPTGRMQDQHQLSGLAPDDPLGSFVSSQGPRLAAVEAHDLKHKAKVLQFKQKSPAEQDDASGPIVLDEDD
ncbi:MAG: hypothetical protein LDL30_02405 [Desulfovibrio sp.]|nr:hypothetical protein [Desulfovibrio sp.]MCA1986108.1 hypothetical protein [Desulfovibrio sp.]